MRRGNFKEAKISLYVLSAVLFVFVMFYLIATMFTSMGYRGKRTETVANVTKENDLVIIIDPGHGGEDPGATDNGLIEKELNLDVALKIEKIFNSCGYNTVLTRTNDILLYRTGEESKKKYYDLRNREQIAESYENSIFVSIHMNKFPLEYCKGLQTFYSKNNVNSENLALSIQESARLFQKDNTRVVKDGSDSIYLMEHLDMPAVLVECGFLSNLEEAQKLSDEEYRGQLAFAIYCGIANYLEVEQYEN